MEGTSGDYKLIHVAQKTACVLEISKGTDDSVAGLCTDAVSSCVAVIVRSSDNSHIILCHADENTNLADLEYGLPEWIKKASSNFSEECRVEVHCGAGSTGQYQEAEYHLRKILTILDGGFELEGKVKQYSDFVSNKDKILHENSGESAIILRKGYKISETTKIVEEEVFRAGKGFVLEKIKKKTWELDICKERDPGRIFYNCDRKILALKKSMQPTNAYIKVQDRLLEKCHEFGVPKIITGMIKNYIETKNHEIVGNEKDIGQYVKHPPVPYEIDGTLDLDCLKQDNVIFDEMLFLDANKNYLNEAGKQKLAPSATPEKPNADKNSISDLQQSNF